MPLDTFIGLTLVSPLHISRVFQHTFGSAVHFWLFTSRISRAAIEGWELGLATKLKGQRLNIYTDVLQIDLLH